MCLKYVMQFWAILDPPLSLIMLCYFLTDPSPSCPNDDIIYVQHIFLEEEQNMGLQWH